MKTTHIKLIREKYAHNQATILKVTGMSILEYNNLILVSGCSFLEQYYNRNIPEQNEWYLNLATNKDYCFWKWFINEFKLAENDFITVFDDDFKKETYIEFISKLPNDRIINKGIFEHIKNLSYVEL